MSIDLQEATRRDDVFTELGLIKEKISALPVFPSLMWVWTYDVIDDIFKTNQGPAEEWQEQVIAEGVTLKQIWDKFWEDTDSLGLHSDLGGEIIEETITDWMRENNFLVSLDDDSWLDEEEDEDGDD
jgi:hypothetical protein